jgi:hypothetical protein
VIGLGIERRAQQVEMCAKYQRYAAYHDMNENKGRRRDPQGWLATVVHMWFEPVTIPGGTR